jgi:hypothetical protein
MHHLKIRSENIYNMDEKGFLLGQALKVKVICRKGRKNPRYSQDGNREMVTVIECVSADGRVIPPMYIYKGTMHLMGWHAGVTSQREATFAWSKKRWTDRELGLEWIKGNFQEYTKDIYVPPN